MAASDTRSRGSLEVWAVSLAFLLLGVGLVVYGYRDWLPALASRHGAGIDAMLAYLLAATGTLVLIGFTVLAGLIWTSGHRAVVTTRLAAPRAEVGISLVLALVMAGIAEGGVLAIGLPVWREYFEAAPPPDALTIEVTAQQFFWNVRYPGRDGRFGRIQPRLIDDATNPLGLDAADPASSDDIVLTNMIVAAVNRPVHLRLHAKDVIHSFFLPNFRVKQDAIPGMVPEVTFVPTKTGTFELACAELCGLGHYRMQGYIKVVQTDQFDGALREESGQ